MVQLYCHSSNQHTGVLWRVLVGTYREVADVAGDLDPRTLVVPLDGEVAHHGQLQGHRLQEQTLRQHLRAQHQGPRTQTVT